MEIHVKRLSDHAKLPVYATEGSAGMDLSACLDTAVELLPGDRVFIPTGICVQVTGEDAVGLVFARSGLATRHGITLANGVGVIDSDYIGEIICALINLGDAPYTIQPGDRIAQLVFVPVYCGKVVEVDQLVPTIRGDGGFGSTGVR
jgi:dUTP pyrophosphatase